MKFIMTHDKAETTRHLSQIDPQVWRIPWIVDSRGLGNGHATVRYLARYEAKSAPSEQCLLGFDPEATCASTAKAAPLAEWCPITLTVDEFLRRWCLRTLPKGLMRVPHYGLLSTAAKAKLERLRHILGVLTPSRPPAPEPLVVKCACCGKPMLSLGHIEALPLWRSLRHHTQFTRGPPTATS